MAAASEILILTGAPGAGKTSVARLLAQHWQRSVHLESDRFFEFVANGYVEPWRSAAHGQNQAVMKIVGEAAAGYVRAGYSTVIDGIVLPGGFFEPLRDALRDQGLAVAYAVLHPPLYVALERAKARSNGLSDPSVVEQLWNGFADLGPLGRHAFDSSRHSPAETAATVQGALTAGVLSV